MPWISQSRRTLMAHRGTAADRPIRSTSSGPGSGEKHVNGARAMESVWLRIVPPAGVEQMYVASHGTMSSWFVTVNTMAGMSNVPLGVATSTPAGTITGLACVAASQNVTSVDAADGAKSLTPMSSRNLT